MKNRTRILLAAFALHSALNIELSTAQAQGSAFTYQGRLADNGAAASGTHDFTFTLYDAASGGATVGVSNVVNDLAVSNKLFTTALDFGAAVFDGSARWLQIAVRPGASTGAYTNLTPRQAITTAPYALRALSAGSATTATSVAAGAVNNTALALNAVTAANIADDTITSADLTSGLLNGTFWKLGGNTGTAPGTQFLGTTDNQPLEIKVNGLRALRLEHNSNGAPNLIGGSPRNIVAVGVVGATIAGGGATNHLGSSRTNAVGSDYGTVGGGLANQIAAASAAATIAGGFANNIGTNAYASAIGGGSSNTIAAYCDGATVAGGTQNDIGNNSSDSTIGGGDNNNIAANSYGGTIAGGERNNIGYYSMYSTISGGFGNTVASNSWVNTIAGGEGNRIGTDSRYATILGGWFNKIGNHCNLSTIAGGYDNTIAANSAVATIAGGEYNNIASNSPYATILGGNYNNVGAGAAYASAAGRRAKAKHPGTFVWADSQDVDFASTATNQFSLRAAGGVRLDGTTSLAFGTTTRQMLSLYGVEYGIGVQDFTVYQRTAAAGGNGFAWFKGGSHTNAQNNPGAGGTVLMTLGSGGLIVNGTFVSASDQNLKQDFAAVDSRAVLEKVVQLPIQTWNYKADTATRHVGPMAQDFYAAFAVGTDDKHIATVDADGVALAAIQGLNLKLEVTQRENLALHERVEKLEKLLQKLVNE